MGKLGGYLYGAELACIFTNVSDLLTHDFGLVVDTFDAYEHLLQGVTSYDVQFEVFQ